MSAIVSGLIGGIVATALVAVAKQRQKQARMDFDGWRSLHPGWLLIGTIAGCAVIAAFVAYFLLTGGSSRPDADTQNRWALLLGMAFGLCAIYTAWASYGRTVSWRGEVLRVRSILGTETLYSLAELSSVTRSESRGEYLLRFRDGGSLRISMYMNGSAELVAATNYADV